VGASTVSIDQLVAASGYAIFSDSCAADKPTESMSSVA
jgi:hypothetical protein